ncbi:MAG: leucine dehydrogenase [Candidatus Woesebacteria bacterium GW2011_GWB1_38_5]|uniref:Leucine dehydrogenase n=3 Tax=Candidatus Woeseibacteriota TaxID=1752722 RepID=A0A0G0P3Y9_9BACT|nr:MAG: leucine dehydrogenase [Candidatus Woesebacteria bacterium GW2011_GWC1_38_13]KKQ75483.1 MAG: leucine dehydrogenase [Candidatus Woesebacteria bacterium GW2011_GWB1_38_5]KKQ76428.1 MAG: leucine dehydrogenase [Microgenomates group bacterium GW2011_GWF1_38_5]KKQ84021.1 MAG: leucine dehydrogenase [Candidatus Woesebacteria bacterium GW2011_GWA1_38_8]
MTTASFNTFSDFDDHKVINYFQDEKSGLRGFITVHRGNCKFPAFGATRYWSYQDEKSALIDSLRLSKLMSHKAALAGIPCGGGKAVIIKDANIRNKKDLLRIYADRVNLLGGHFITGADVGISREDVITMRRRSPYFVGVMVDPVRFTGLGLLLGIKACLSEVFHSDSLANRSFAIQGVGKIGNELIKLIYPFAQKIYVADIDPKAVKTVGSKFPKVKVVNLNEINQLKVDVFSPCALSNCLNKNSVNRLNCGIVAGGANNQLESEDVAETLFKKSILYAPDYVVNAGGLISVYDEYENGNTRVSRVEKKVLIVEKNMRAIIFQSKKTGKNPAEIANSLAREIFDNLV